jgi:mono/diheme cytochrome c family protein
VNDSALFSFRFCAVHPKDASDCLPRQLFEVPCWQCHGFQGQGSVATSNGKALAPDPMPWEGFSTLVRTSNTGMPPYTEKVLSNDDLADIYAYLQSIPKPADYKSIPLLNQ